MLGLVVAGVSARAEWLTGVVRSQTQAVANVVVYMSSGPGGLSNPPPAELELVHGGFVPRIQIARSGAALVLRNGDATLHVVQVMALDATNAPVGLLTEAMPYAGYEKSFPLERHSEPRLLKATTGNGEEGPVAYVAMIPHGWAALTDAQGRFAIRAVPPGNYKLFLWHETLGTTTREVRVTGERTTPVELEY